jgi:hypothetical protein
LLLSNKKEVFFVSLSYGFYNSIGGDRKYNAEQLSSLFDGIINDGVFASIGDALTVSVVSGMSLKVGIGRAWFNNTWTYNDSDLVIVLDASEIAFNRIDMIILEVNSSEDVRANSIKVLKGIPGTVPVAPTLTNTETIHQYQLAQIYIGSAVTEIVSGNITSKIGSSECPYVAGITVINIDNEEVFSQSVEKTLMDSYSSDSINFVMESSYGVGKGLADYAVYKGSVASFTNLRACASITGILASQNAIDEVAADSNLLDIFISMTTNVGTFIAKAFGFTLANFSGLATFNDICGNITAINQVITSTVLMNIIINNALYMNTVSGNATIMAAIMNSATASEIYLTSGYKVGMGIDTLNVANGGTTNTTLNELNSMTAIAASSTSMDTIVASSAVMDYLKVSTVAMTALCANTISADKISNNATAFGKIANSTPGFTAWIANAISRLSMYTAAAITESILSASTNAIALMTAGQHSVVGLKNTAYAGKAFVLNCVDIADSGSYTQTYGVFVLSPTSITRAPSTGTLTIKRFASTVTQNTTTTNWSTYFNIFYI